MYERLRDRVPEVFTRYRIEPEDLEPWASFAPADTVLLTGSYARGEATASSDLDLTVICDAPPPRRPGTRGYPSILGDSVVAARIDALVINVDFLRRDALRSVCAVLASSGDGPAASNIANLGPLELRALERTGTGVVLQLGTHDAALIEVVDLPRARANTAAIAFLEGRSHLRAVQTGELDPASRSLRLFRAAECLLSAEVNALGALTYDVKHLAGRVRRLAGRPCLDLLDELTAARDGRHHPGADALEVRAEAVADAFLASLGRDAGRGAIRALLRPVVPALGAQP